MSENYPGSKETSTDVSAKHAESAHGQNLDLKICDT